MQNDTHTGILYSNHHCKFTEHEYTRASVLSSHIGAILVAKKLTNKIHPLFDAPLRKAVEDFSVVEQSARLASQFLECGLLDRVYLAIANEGNPGRSWREKADHKSVGLKIPREQLIKKKKFDGRRAQGPLKHLSQTISFALSNKIDVHGATQSIRNKAYVDSKFPNAEKSKSKIAESLYHGLEKARGTEDTPYLLYLQVDLAITLVHETGHAVDRLTHSKLWHGHFLGENIVREVGFDIENQLFGGHLTTLYEGKADTNAFRRYWYHHKHPSALRGILVLFEYPYQSLATLYGKTEDIMEIRKQPSDLRRLDVAWRVPIRFLGELFQDSFWKDKLPSDPTALRPECSVGCTFCTGRNGNSIPVFKDRGDKKMMYVPKGYRRLKIDGSIVLDDPENDEFVTTTNFWEGVAQKYSSDNNRPWQVIPDGSDDLQLTHMPCENYMDDVDSDTEKVD